MYVLTDSQENPELIWNDEAREKVSDVVKGMAHKSVPAKILFLLCVAMCVYLPVSYRFFEEQKSNPDVQWKVG